MSRRSFFGFVGSLLGAMVGYCPAPHAARGLKSVDVRRFVQATLRDLGPVRFSDVSVPLQGWLAMRNRRAS